MFCAFAYSRCRHVVDSGSLNSVVFSDTLSGLQYDVKKLSLDSMGNNNIYWYYLH